MAVSRWTAWVGAGLLARLLMLAALLMSVRFVLANHTDVLLTDNDYYKLQSYKYARELFDAYTHILVHLC